MKIFKSSLALVLALILAFSSVGMRPEKAKAAQIGDEVITEEKLSLQCFRASSTVYAWAVTGYGGTKAALSIPEYYKDMPVMRIDKEAFMGNTVLKSVSIPASVCKIDARAFKNCSSLESVVFEGDSYEWIKANVPDITSSDCKPVVLGWNIFDECTSLQELELPYGWSCNGNAHGDRLMAGAGIKYLKLVVTANRGQSDPSAFFNECPDLAKVDVVVKNRRLLDLHYMGDFPELKEINIYEDYDIGSGGESTSITNTMISCLQYEKKHISRCPKLEAINVYVGSETVKRGVAFKPFTDTTVTVEGEGVEKKAVNSTYKIISEGTAEFSCPEAIFKVRLFIGGGTTKKDLKDAEAELPVDSFTFRDDEIRPYAVLTYDGTVLVPGVDYECSYSDNKDIGTATVTFSGIGDYTGKLTANYSIVPFGTNLESAVFSGKKCKLTWNRIGQVDGYQVYYSKKASKGYKKLYSGKDTSLDSKAVKSGMYIKVRTYKKVGKTTYYSEWSAPVQVK